MDDEYIWNMAAFLQQLPTLDPEQYQAMVASSDGHDHGGGETRPHDHEQGTPADHDMSREDMDTDGSEPHAHAAGASADHHGTTVPAASTPEPAVETVEHRHADGTVESHPVEPHPATTPVPSGPAAATEADDGHQHQH